MGDTRDEFDTLLKKMNKLTPELRNLMIEAQPYKGGNETLWALHQLNRGDQHRSRLIPLMMPTYTRMSYLRFECGLPLFVGCRTGKHLELGDRSKLPHRALLMPPTALYEAPVGGYFEFGDARSPGDESLEFMTTTPEAQFQTDFQPSLDVSFEHVAVRGKTIAAVLNEMRQTVERTLLTFEERFF